VVVAFTIQTVVISIVAAEVPQWMSEVVHLYSYVLALTFVVVNRKLPGLALLALGAALNAIAVVSNGGVMPASAQAQRVAGLVVADDAFANSAVVKGARFQILGDVFAIPKGYPLANVFSIGDVLLVIGAGLVLHHACGSRLIRRSPQGQPSLGVS
jgi:hypothetical protein